MTDVVFSLGAPIKDWILWFAALLGSEAVPGFVALLLVVMLASLALWTTVFYRERAKAVRALRQALERTTGQLSAEALEEVDSWVERNSGSKAKQSVGDAWKEFSETLVLDTTQEPPVFRNAVRPGLFFNPEDLHFGGGFFRIMPGLFVSIGLSLTFLGLIAALNSMGSGGAINDATMANLLRIASAKFIMSLTGLGCSILFTIGLRVQTGGLENELHALCRTLEKKLAFVSLEFLGFEQLRAMKEAQDHSRALTTEVIAELGRPLREELPNAISTSISSAMEPILAQVSRHGSDSVSTLASDLSQQLTSNIGAALTAASDKLAQAGDRIGALSDRMDQSSGRIGSEMEQAIARVAVAVEELREGMSASAESTSSVFSAGAEQMMAVMNETLEGIRDNTAEGAKAMATSAAELSQAAAGMRAELQAATRSGAEEAQQRIQEAGAQAGSAIDSAGRSIMDSFGKAGVDIARLAEQFSDKAGKDLLDPIAAIASKLDEMVGALEQGTTDVRRASDAVREGAKAGEAAAGSFRAASQELTAAALPVKATSERIEGSLRQWSDTIRDGQNFVKEAAQKSMHDVDAILQAARAAIGAERTGIETSLAHVAEMLERMRGQGDRLDTIDEKLGAAFDLYTDQTEGAMQAIRTHVQTMSQNLNLAVSQLDNAIQQLQEFSPEQAIR